jgi:hypothetical protein
LLSLRSRTSAALATLSSMPLNAGWRGMNICLSPRSGWEVRLLQVPMSALENPELRPRFNQLSDIYDSYEDMAGGK